MAGTMEAAEEILKSVTLVPLDPRIVETAATLPPTILRSLDAIHLADGARPRRPARCRRHLRRLHAGSSPRFGPDGGCAVLSRRSDLEQELNFDRDTERQFRNTDGGASVPPGLAKHVEQQL